MGESTLALRVVEFVCLRRGGMNDKEAFRSAMDIAFAALAEKYDGDKTGGDEAGEA